jgi:hypothetical protein
MACGSVPVDLWQVKTSGNWTMGVGGVGGVGGGFLSQLTLFSIWSQVRTNPELRFTPTADVLCHCKCDRSQGAVVQFNLCGVLPLQFAL